MIGWAVFAGLTVVTNQKRDHTTDRRHICVNSPHLCSECVRCQAKW